MSATRFFRILATLALILVSASFAGAQPTPGGVTGSLSPDAGSVPQGEPQNTTLSVHNAGPPTVVSFSSNATGVAVSFDQNSVPMLPNADLKVAVTIQTNASTPLGVRVVPITITSTTGPATTLNFTLTVLAPPANDTGPTSGTGSAPPVSPARVGPASFRLHAAVGETADALLNVTNPDNASRSYHVQTTQPRGWSVSPNDVPLTIAANGSALVQIGFTAAMDAPDASSAIIRVVGDGGGAVEVPVTLARDGPPPQATTEPPPPTPTPTPTQDAPPQAPAAATPPPTNAPSEPPASPPTLSVEPGEITLALDAPGHGTLHVASSRAATISLRLALPPTLQTDLPATVLVAAGQPVDLPFTLRLAKPITVGSSFSLAIQAGDATAPFRARVVAATPAAVETATTNAPDAPRFALGGLSIAGLALGGAALVAVAARRKWTPWLVALYARLRPDAVQAHPARAKLLQMVREQPGVSYGDAQRRLALGNGQMAHHVHVLERARLLVSAPDGQLRRLYAPGATRVVTAALGERALELISARGAMPASTLARELGVSRQALRYHLDKLEREKRIVLRASLRGLVVERVAEAAA